MLGRLLGLKLYGIPVWNCFFLSKYKVSLVQSWGSCVGYALFSVHMEWRRGEQFHCASPCGSITRSGLCEVINFISRR